MLLRMAHGRKSRNTTEFREEAIIYDQPHGRMLPDTKVKHKGGRKPLPHVLPPLYVSIATLSNTAGTQLAMAIAQKATGCPRRRQSRKYETPVTDSQQTAGSAPSPSDSQLAAHPEHARRGEEGARDGTQPGSLSASAPPRPESGRSGSASTSGGEGRGLRPREGGAAGAAGPAAHPPPGSLPALGEGAGQAPPAPPA